MAHVHTRRPVPAGVQSRVSRRAAPRGSPGPRHYGATGGWASPVAMSTRWRRLRSGSPRPRQPLDPGQGQPAGHLLHRRRPLRGRLRPGPRRPVRGLRRPPAAVAVRRGGSGPRSSTDATGRAVFRSFDAQVGRHVFPAAWAVEAVGYCEERLGRPLSEEERMEVFWTAVRTAPDPCVISDPRAALRASIRAFQRTLDLLASPGRRLVLLRSEEPLLVLADGGAALRRKDGTFCLTPRFCPTRSRSSPRCRRGV